MFQPPLSKKVREINLYEMWKSSVSDFCYQLQKIEKINPKLSFNFSQNQDNTIFSAEIELNKKFSYKRLSKYLNSSKMHLESFLVEKNKTKVNLNYTLKNFLK